MEAALYGRTADLSRSIEVLSFKAPERLYYIDLLSCEEHHSFFFSRLAGSGMVLNCFYRHSQL